MRAKGEVVAALGALGEREMEAVRVWVAAACEGPQPAPDAEERARLTARLAEATRAAEVARLASVDLDAEAGRLQGRLGAIARQVFARRSSRPCSRSSRRSRAATVDAMRTQSENLLQLKALMEALTQSRRKRSRAATNSARRR